MHNLKYNKHILNNQIFIPQLKSYTSINFLYIYKPDQFFNNITYYKSRKKKYKNIIKILTISLKNYFQ